MWMAGGCGLSDGSSWGGLSKAKPRDPVWFLRDPTQLHGFEALRVWRPAARPPSDVDLFPNCSPISLRVIKQSSQCGAFHLSIFQMDAVPVRIESLNLREQLARQSKVADQACGNCSTIDVSVP